MKHRLTNRIALALLILATLAYGVFLAAPLGEGMRGWEIWLEVVEIGRTPDWSSMNVSDNLLLAGFVSASFLAIASPFLFGFLVRSRLMWWLMVTIALLALIGFSGNYLREGYGFTAAIIWLMASQGFNLAGLLLVRRKTEDPVFPHSPVE